MRLDVCSIVEGQGEVAAVPLLVRRLGAILKPNLEVNILRPIRVPRNKVLKQGELERAIELAMRQSRPPRVLFILLDADDDPPCTFGPELLARARKARSDVIFGVVLANREFESWFLSSLESLQGRCGLAENLPSLTNSETKRDAKGELSKHMKDRIYSPVPDQVKLTAIFDMDIARQNSDSFDKCWREIERLLNEGAAQTS
ncbi:MAG: DUF4276 family protein [Thermoguttaceae bacterium]|jgi:hypothetical protein